MKNPDIGAMVSEGQMNDVLKYIEIGKEEGAVCLCGGERHMADGCDKGFFIRPTVFDNCTPDMRIVREEIFGPVVAIQAFETEEEAIALANDTDYGLAGAYESCKSCEGDPCRYHLDQLLQPLLRGRSVGRIQNVRHRQRSRGTRS